MDETLVVLLPHPLQDTQATTRLVSSRSDATIRLVVFRVVTFLRDWKMKIKTSGLNKFLCNQVRSIMTQVMCISNQQFTGFIGNP